MRTFHFYRLVQQLALWAPCLSRNKRYLPPLKSSLKIHSISEGHWQCRQMILKGMRLHLAQLSSSCFLPTQANFQVHMRNRNGAAWQARPARDSYQLGFAFPLHCVKSTRSPSGLVCLNFMSLQFISTFNFHSVPPIRSWFSQEACLKAWQESIRSIWSCTNGSCYSLSYRSPITTTLWFWIKRTRITSCCEYGLAQRALDLIWGSVGGTGTVQWARWFPAALGFNGLGRRALTLKILFP